MQTWLNLQDKIIIVTGGASGIGLAIVEELLAQGANVQMVDIHGGDGQYEGHKGYQFWPTDISSAKEVNHTVAEIIQRFGRIDGLVNNAGVNFPRLLVDEKAPAGQYELNEAAFEKMVNINQKGVFLMSQAVARQMVKQHDGVIVNVSSESGLEGSEGQSCYAATKAALNSFTRSWSKELGKHGIRVVGIAPGILEKTSQMDKPLPSSSIPPSICSALAATPNRKSFGKIISVPWFLKFSLFICHPLLYSPSSNAPPYTVFPEA